MKKFLNFTFLFFVLLFTSGCSTLTYVGDDYVANNTQTIKTSEDFLFNVYKKQLGDANVKIGISKTPIAELLALYVQIENYSYDTPFVFKVEDLRVSTQNGNIPFITTNNYLSIWQNQEAASMAQMGTMSATLTTMTGLTSNYNDYNQGIAQNAAQQTTASAFNTIEATGNQILKHSIRLSSTINPRKSQYFYFFFEDTEEELTVKYKTLEYKFKI